MADKTKLRLRDSDMPFVEKALKRHLRRPPAPDLDVTSDGDGWHYSSPYEGQEAEWEILLFNAFGTRSRSTFRVFIDHLVSLCGQTYDYDAKEWRPDHNELAALINIVNAHRPRNETEACAAAQIAAAYLMSMKLAGRAMMGGFVDERTAATTARMFRASAALNDTMLKMKGRKVHRQSIKVSHEKHIHQHHHQHVHVTGESGEFGEQPDAAMERRIGSNGQGATLPGPDQMAGRVLSFPCSEGQESVQDARRKGRGAKG